MGEEPASARDHFVAAVADLAAGDLVALANGILTKVHKRTECDGRALACWIHSPSQWQLATAPVVWDQAAGRAYRRCGHGTLHRDLDDYRWQTRYSTRYAGMPAWCCSGPSDCACCRGSQP